MIRVIFPSHLRNLARLGSDVTLEVVDLETRLFAGIAFHELKDIQ